MSCSVKCPGSSIPAQAPRCGGFKDGVIAWSLYKNPQASNASPSLAPQPQPALSNVIAAVQQPQPQRQAQQSTQQQGTQQQVNQQQTSQQGVQQQSQQSQEQQQQQNPPSQQQQGTQEPASNKQSGSQPTSLNGAPSNQKSILQMIENNVNVLSNQTSPSSTSQSMSTISVYSTFATVTATYPSSSPTNGTSYMSESAISKPDGDGDMDDISVLKAMPTLVASSNGVQVAISAHIIAGIAVGCMILGVGIALVCRRRRVNSPPSSFPIAELDRKESPGDILSLARIYTVREDDIESRLPTADKICTPSPTLERSKGTLDYYRFGSPSSGATLKSTEGDDACLRKTSIDKSSDISANKSVPTLGVLRRDLAVRDSDLYSVRSASSTASKNIASKSLSLARSTSLAKMPEGKVAPRSSRAKRSTNNSNRWNSRMRSIDVARVSYQSSSAPLSPASIYNRHIRASTAAKSLSGMSSTTSRAPSSLFMNVLAYNLAQNAKAEAEARAIRTSSEDDDLAENDVKEHRKSFDDSL
ncbi:hypothetical protein BC830DRAFT_923255 [Chytriomyces sp. MP71]|nr:hypothetical protein BC830DRAFT_923255 [Chytriomyces sp. MP71]